MTQQLDHTIPTNEQLQDEVADLRDRIDKRDQHIKQLQYRLKRRNQPPPSPPRQPVGSFDGAWMGG